MAILELDLQAIAGNYRHLSSLAKLSGIELCLVTKLLAGWPGIFGFLHELGVQNIADSNTGAMARIPLDLREHFNTSLIKTRPSDLIMLQGQHQGGPNRVFVSDPALVEILAGLPRETCPKIILVVEWGDQKDGMYPQDVLSCIQSHGDLPFCGIAANFACLSGRIPDLGDLQRFKDFSEEARRLTRGDSWTVSVGGTVLHGYLARGELQGLVDEIRVGEGVFLGLDSSGNGSVPGCKQQTATLLGEVLELATKDIVVETQDQGRNALGGHGLPRPEGLRRSAVLDFGVLIGPAQHLVPLDKTMQVVGQTFDFTVVDLGPAAQQADLRPGDFIAFDADYTVVAQAAINRFVTIRGKEEYDR